jgi:molecular chaperone GrpE (heat shock protein)
MKDIFKDLGIEATQKNKKDIDKAIHKIVKTEYKNCPEAWKRIKEHIRTDEKTRDKFVNALKKELKR